MRPALSRCFPDRLDHGGTGPDWLLAQQQDPTADRHQCVSHQPPEHGAPTPHPAPLEPRARGHAAGSPRRRRPRSQTVNGSWRHWPIWEQEDRQRTSMSSAGTMPFRRQDRSLDPHSPTTLCSGCFHKRPVSDPSREDHSADCPKSNAGHQCLDDYLLGVGTLQCEIFGLAPT